MSKKLEEILESFSAFSPDEQLAKIEQIRDTRTIERPAVAVRRRKKEKTRSEKAKTKLKTLMKEMSPEELAALKQALGGNDE